MPPRRRPNTHNIVVKGLSAIIIHHLSTELHTTHARLSSDGSDVVELLYSLISSHGNPQYRGKRFPAVDTLCDSIDSHTLDQIIPLWTKLYLEINKFERLDPVALARNVHLILMDNLDTLIYILRKIMKQLNLQSSNCLRMTDPTSLAILHELSNNTRRPSSPTGSAAVTDNSNSSPDDRHPATLDEDVTPLRRAQIEVYLSPDISLSEFRQQFTEPAILSPLTCPISEVDH